MADTRVLVLVLALFLCLSLFNAAEAKKSGDEKEAKDKGPPIEEIEGYDPVAEFSESLKEKTGPDDREQDNNKGKPTKEKNGYDPVATFSESVKEKGNNIPAPVDGKREMDF